MESLYPIPSLFLPEISFYTLFPNKKEPYSGYEVFGTAFEVSVISGFICEESWSDDYSIHHSSMGQDGRKSWPLSKDTPAFDSETLSSLDSHTPSFG